MISLHKSQPGHVTIAGAGPGDPELLTVKTLNRIRGADAIVYDALVSEDIQALFPRAAQAYPAGKRAGDPLSSTQESINALLERLARLGLCVLRLKGGDPFIFGRGAEEALYLKDRGIPFEVLPAVSSVNGAAATALAPLTHRGVSRGFTVLQGQRGLLEQIEWEALVRLGGTWVFLMARATVADIASRLIGAGARPGLGMAVVENATLPSQVVTRKSLLDFSRHGFEARTSGPALVLAGATLALPLDGLHLAPEIGEAGSPFSKAEFFGGAEFPWRQQEAGH